MKSHFKGLGNDWSIVSYIPPLKKQRKMGYAIVSPILF